MDNCFTSRVICWLYVRNVLLYFSPWITTNVLKILFYKVDKTIVRTVAIMQVTTWVGSPCQIIYVTFEQCIYWGHSTTTWTKFYTILITYPPRVDNCGHFTWYTVSNNSYCFWADLLHKWSFLGYDWHPLIYPKCHAYLLY